MLVCFLRKRRQRRRLHEKRLSATLTPSSPATCGPRVLLPAFDSWRTRGLSDLAPIGVARGSFDWLIQEFKRQQKW